MTAPAGFNSLPTWLFVGGTGRVGRMLRCIWHRASPRHSIIWQRRVPADHADDDWVWDPSEGLGGLVGLTRSRSQVQGMLIFAGVTPSVSANYSQNVDILENCIAAARYLGISRLIVASSSAVYGASVFGPIPESAPLLPVNEYGRSKVLLEEACVKYRYLGLQIGCLRIGNVLGADALLVNARLASESNPLRVNICRDGYGMRRTYIGPATLARVLDTLMSMPLLPECINVGMKSPLSMDQLARRSGVPWVPVSIADDRLQNITLDCDRLAALAPGLLDPIGVEPMFGELESMGLWT